MKQTNDFIYLKILNKHNAGGNLTELCKKNGIKYNQYQRWYDSYLHTLREEVARKKDERSKEIKDLSFHERLTIELWKK